MDKDIIEYLADRLRDRISIKPSGCWEFQGRKAEFGYGVIDIRYLGISGAPSTITTHRLMYLAEHGAIPDGLCVLHRCDNPPCCNPAHLWLGTRMDNNKDARSKGRIDDAARIKKVRKAWRDPELRKRQSAFLERRWAKHHEQKAKVAGVPPDWKRCYLCGEWKPREGYSKCAARADGLQSRCIPCQNKVRAAWRKKRKAAGLPTH
jgi:hypothetical protein